jgi:hypothetical protein
MIRPCTACTQAPGLHWHTTRGGELVLERRCPCGRFDGYEPRTEESERLAQGASDLARKQISLWEAKRKLNRKGKPK